MRSKQGRAVWDHLVADLRQLQRTWEGRATKVVERGLSLRAHGVVFGIETGRRTIEARKASSPAQLTALVGEWESIAKLSASGPAFESIRGIDYGIRLVIDRVRRHLNQDARPKSPGSADGAKASLRCKRKPHASA